jgi:uncharacterized protein
MRILFVLLVGVCVGAMPALADTVRLKNGTVVEGKIIEKTADAVKMEVSGVALTYYNDEIDAEQTAQGEDAVQPAPVTDAAAVDDLSSMSKDALIRKFVQIYGVKENMQANFDQMTASLKPDQAEAFRAAIKVDDIIQELLPVYDKHFSENDLRAYIRFYSSPEGKKLVQTLPLLMKDSVDVSMKYLDVHLPASLKEAQPDQHGN